uniref:glutathione transferase n=2 Tax=Acrobeloides nanus TaxID=290746 RepID=A0A914CWT3_9BILA
MPIIPQYTLKYFDGMGRAETIRLIFAAAGVSYKDERIPKEKWPEVKNSTPFGQLPVLEMDGKFLAQSHAIEKFLGRMFGLMGADDWEAAKIDEIILALEDVHQSLRPWFIEQNETKKIEIFKGIVADSIDPFLARVTKILEENDRTHLVGKELSVADLGVFQFVWFLNNKLLPGHLKRYAVLETFAKKTEHLPKIKEWIDKRPKTDF